MEIAFIGDVSKVEAEYYEKGIWRRQSDRPTPETELIGARMRRGRQQAGLSQRRVAERAGVSQSEVSRLERGKGGGISTYRLVAIALAIPGLPFGCCPHQHTCAYPFDPRRSPI